MVNSICPDGHVLHWQSQPMIRGMAAGNLLLSAPILLRGLVFTDIACLVDLLILAVLSERRFCDLHRGLCVSCSTYHLFKAARGCS